jgi:hypothetical protein
MCKDVVNRDSTFRVMSRLEGNSSSLSAIRTMCHPVRTSIYLLLHPSRWCVVPSERQTVQHHPSGRRASSVRTLHCIEKFLFQLDPSGRLSSTSGHLSVLERFTNSFQIQEREDQSTVRTRVSKRQESQFEFHRPNAWQLWSGRWCIVYGNWRFDFNFPDVSPSWSGRTRIRYGNCVLKFSRPDAPAP